MHAQHPIPPSRQLMSTAAHDKKLIAAFTLTSPSLCKCTIFIKIVSLHSHTHTPLSLPLGTPLVAHTRPLNTAHRAAVAAIVCANAQRKRDTSIL